MGLETDATGNQLTFQVIGAAMAVHNTLGPGYKEEVYEAALAAELQQRNFRAVRQVPTPVMYHEEQVALFYLDLVVENQVVVELKAFSHQLTNDELAQMLNYLKASQLPVGLLFNFGRRRLEYRLVFPGKAGIDPQRLGRDSVVRPGKP